MNIWKNPKEELPETGIGDVSILHYSNSEEKGRLRVSTYDVDSIADVNSIKRRAKYWAYTKDLIAQATTSADEQRKNFIENGVTGLD